MKIIASLGIVVTLAVSLQAKDRDWLRGTILDAETVRQRVDTGAETTVTVSPDYEGGSAVTANTRTSHLELTETQMLVEGPDYLYVVEKQTSRTWDGKPALVLASAVASLTQHSCRIVMGDSITYAKSKGKLYVLGLDGHECKFDILRQQPVQR